jgi:hypothetical protein
MSMADEDTSLAYQDIIDNFEALFDNASVLIENIENLRFTTADTKKSDGNNLKHSIDIAVQDTIKE